MLPNRLGPPFAFAPALLAATFAAFPLTAAEPSDPEPPTVSDVVEVTATRVPEAVEPVPVAITVVTGEELRARGARDLASALALVPGVVVAPGGDGGPASAVPELWGLREIDAFLLVVDDVPWGGAFNPAVSTLLLENVERIEVLKGPAPVMYGATSFVGVVHVIHREPGAGPREARAWGGSHDSGGLLAAGPIPAIGAWRHSLTASLDRRGFDDPEAGVDEGQVLYRGAVEAAGGRVSMDLQATRLRQDPNSPHPRTGRVLTDLVPRDANHNPDGAFLDQDRVSVRGRYERAVAGGDWSTTLSLARTDLDVRRGFLRDLDGDVANAVGYEQTAAIDDVYLDSHFAKRLRTDLRIVAGADLLAGRGERASANSLYSAAISGGDRGSLADGALLETTELEDERLFSGLYAQAEWTPFARWRIDAGLRLNHVTEDREGEAEPEGEEEEPGEEEGGADAFTTTRLSGSVGVSWLAWSRGDDGAWLFADYRSAFKPAALDFGPEAEAEILEPETSESWELGVKAQLFGGRLDGEATAFRSDLENLVAPAVVDGFPVLRNSGTQRLQGLELGAGLAIRPDLRARASYAWHDPKFLDDVRFFDGVPFQLRGNRPEMAAEHLASLGVVWAPRDGFRGSVTASYVGERYLDKRNRSLAEAVTTVDAGIGWNHGHWAVRLDGENLGDERPPVAESELGDAQYYLLPGRSLLLSVGFHG